MTIPKDEIAERIGLLADTCDNLHSASLLPLKAEQHLPILREAILELRNDLRKLHGETTGENTWELWP